MHNHPIPNLRKETLTSTGQQVTSFPCQNLKIRADKGKAKLTKTLNKGEDDHNREREYLKELPRESNPVRLGGFLFS